MIRIKSIIADIFRYPSAIFGSAIIALLIGLALYTVIAIPYQTAIDRWRGGEQVWIDYPKTAGPVWYNWFTSEKLSESQIIETESSAVTRTEEAVSGDTRRITYDIPIQYEYDTFPTELNLTLYSTYESKAPFYSFVWVKPDGTEVRPTEYSPTASRYVLRFGLDEQLKAKLRGMEPQEGLFSTPESTRNEANVMAGEYHLIVTALVFEPEADVNAKLVIYGELSGLAGTDHLRRDLTLPLMWGTPIALTFGLLAAVGTSIATLIIAAVGVWYGGWLDGAIQRITEVNSVLPLLSILVMVGVFYSRSIWTMLGVVILLSIFGLGIKTFRAVFLQVKESPYIEAARSYGANNNRLIFRYLIPRIIPLLIPQLVVAVPTYVFLEATLAVLGLGDPVLPTWGKVIDDARQNGAVFNGYYYWILEPAVLLMLTGLGFSMLGFALDRVFNPRLREM